MTELTCTDEWFLERDRRAVLSPRVALLDSRGADSDTVGGAVEVAIVATVALATAGAIVAALVGVRRLLRS